jgi:hypothetical protein
MSNFADTIDELFTGVVLLAIIAALVSTKSSGKLILDLGDMIAALTGIVVNPVSGSASK